MMDLRELARRVPPDGAQPKFDRAITRFLEVCDFVAHSNRDRGVVEQNIREHVERLANALAKGDEEQWANVVSVRDVIYGDELVAGMLGLAYLFLYIHDANVHHGYLQRAFARKEDLSLCIISILQDAVIELKGGRGHSLLHIVSFEGKYRLYCQVLGSKLEQDARARTGGAGRLIIGFPVVVTNAQDIDHVLPQLSDSSPLLPDTTELPPVVDIYRGADGLLHVKRLSQ